MSTAAFFREQLVALLEALKASPPSQSVPSVAERSAIIVGLLALEDAELEEALDRD
jgi:hypothetical protein